MDRDKIYLQEIMEFCEKVGNFIGGLSYEQFIEDEKTQLAVIKLIENIGEASKRLSPEIKARYADVNWPQAAKMRDRLTHHYMDVDLAIVFDVAINEIPKLARNLK